MRLLGRWAVAAIAVVHVTAGIASAQIQATPEAWRPEQVKAKTDAFVAEQIAVYTRKAPDREIKAALKLAQMVHPDEPAALAQLAYQLGPEGSDQDFLDILAFRPDDNLANVYLAGNLSDEGYVNLALPYFAKAAAQRPEAGWLQYNAGMNAFYADDDAACITYFSRALSAGISDDDIPQTYLKRGECYARAGKKKEAKADFGKVQGMGGAYSVRMLNDGAFDGCGWSLGSVDDRVRNAAATADNWKTYEGYRDLTKILMCEPKHAGALKERLKLEERDPNLKRHAQVHRIQLQNLQDGGATYATRLKAMQPATTAQMLAQGQAIEMSNDTNGDKRRRAAYLASRVLMLEPDNAQARLLRARAVVNLNIGPLSALAWDDATRALQADKRLAVAHFVRSVLFIRGKGYNEAATELSAAIALDPNDMRFYAQRGDSYAMVGKNEAAVQDLTRFLASNPKDMAALQARAKANHGLRKYQAAFNDLDAAFKIDPVNFTVRASIVVVLDDMGRKADADAVHIMLLADHEAEAKKHAYLAGRTTAELSAKAADVKKGLAFAALEKRAQDRFQAFVDQYSPGEYSYENLVRKMQGVSSNDGQKTLDSIRETARYADERLKAARRLGVALVDSDDAAGLTEEQLGKLAAWILHVESMQEGLARIMTAIR